MKYAIAISGMYAMFLLVWAGMKIADAQWGWAITYLIMATIIISANWYYWYYTGKLRGLRYGGAE